MLVTLRFPGAAQSLPMALLGGETERHEEFWFGQGLAWSALEDGTPALHLSLVLDVPRIVAKTKRRDREERFAVGYCDAFAYSAAGLVGLFMARLWMPVPGDIRCVEIELVSYPKRPHSEAIAQRLFGVIGYIVSVDNGTLHLAKRSGIKEALDALPALLLTLDRRTRLFLAEDELAEIGRGHASWIHRHPASRAIELSLRGKPTPLRFLVPETEAGSKHGSEQIEIEVLNGDSPITTTHIPRIAVSPSQMMFAQKAASKMNIDRRWLVYLPSAISSVQARSGELETPEEAIRYYSGERIEHVVVEEKHMGSRGIVILCRNHKTAAERFGVKSEIPGCVYTRNGRQFFKDEDKGAVFVDRLGRVLERANFWKRFSTQWVAVDGEILPWAVKASEFSEESDLVETGALVLEKTSLALSSGAGSILKRHWAEVIGAERAALKRYDSIFKHYRTEAADLAALKFAPFHLLAVENQTFFDRSHLWHMQTVAKLARSGTGFLIPTRYEVLNTSDRATWAKSLRWWEELSADSSEGLVVKPLAFVPRGRRGLAQPALKCRSVEHLRLVYGPRYDSTEEKESLIWRNALARRRNKHRRILRQFALSMEAVSRFVKRSPVDAVNECVLGVLALEVAPTDHH